MEQVQKPVWFKAKMYGWGWQPASWQGWVIMLVYIAALVELFAQVDKRAHSVTDTLINFSIFFIPLTILLLLVCYMKGERPHWSWGKK